MLSLFHLFVYPFFSTKSFLDATFLVKMICGMLCFGMMLWRHYARQRAWLAATNRQSSQAIERVNGADTENLTTNE
ncbi:hypothetical protein DF022_22820 [Burkholderia cepacia]|nr:hypothetical protein DF022_22820 [Burkholderia cepacia]